MPWWSYALLSALAASATAILAKVGVKDVPSNLATAIRTVVVLVFAWGVVFASQEHHGLSALRPRSVLFLVLSGVATGVSWLAYFKALQMAPVSHVAPIDKVSHAPHTPPSVCSPNRESTSHRTPRREYRRKCQHLAQTMTHN